MDDVSTPVGLAVVVTAALYLLALGGGALLRPETAKRFLGGFATTARIHFTELALRIVAGVAFVFSAPRMAFDQAIAVFGWMLVATSLALAIVPWRLHQRFAAWVIPQVTRQMPLIGVVSIVGGAILLVAVVLPHIAG